MRTRGARCTSRARGPTSATVLPSTESGPDGVLCVMLIVGMRTVTPIFAELGLASETAAGLPLTLPASPATATSAPPIPIERVP